ncbi:right-handed parallel beta-helix repeat-containing protein [Mucilaginibacter sp. L3T2-6]|uniref:right-handed parallel beta-helix repeat-containing protein n=1 Tax=Mucilaginibacter sp. L3T2-6 TaxID=3062491 RepID=UPI0026747DC9|nr:right-handed parallel beta-helix repeat-containing protein [Mucilaginibacter sp. L3T2-6]MDO3643692.1 right-handed parallel beta-helix repeat-containing protein [Mucilaginibacter sp. L3T2-6]MDV6216060.1 right-handed parallel beta-helix repeat-containing protein [Mucilaginibacter sp. L3T2-6]
MNPKNPCWHRFVPFVIIFVTIFMFSCKKEDAVIPQSSPAAISVTENTPNMSASLATSSTVAQTYVSSPVISLSNASNITISGKAIAGGTKAAITLTNCHDVHITNCKLYNSTNVGIYLYNCYNITINGNYLTNVSTGIYVDHAAKGGIIVNGNQFLNMKGPFPRGQFVQFNNVKGANNQINSNQCENILGQSNPEDAISLYQSYGTSACPISIRGNQIRGGGPSNSGGGIMLGDSGGAYQIADGNTLVNAGQYGIAISGGSHNSITNNLIYSVSQSFTNVGLYVASFSGILISGAQVAGNRVKFYNSSGIANGVWLADGLLAPAGWSTNNWNANIDSSILPAVLITKK